MSAILQLEKVSKSFGSTRALVDMDFQLNKGEIHALVGENGAGKSTMINVMSGVHQPDGGRILYNGREVVIDNSPAGDTKGCSAKALGISVIHQELLLCPTLSVMENVHLGNLPGKGLVDWKAASQTTLEALRVLDDHIMPEDIVEHLTAAQKQIVEIAKAVSTNAAVLIMDEPTTSLTGAEVKKLLEVVRKLRSSGMSIIYISHKLEEVFEIADRITVIRDGQYIETLENDGNVTREDIVKRMVGRSIDNYYVRTNTPSEKIALEVEKLTGPIVQDASFFVKKGEILGFSGLIGAGRSELMTMLFGIDPHTSGTVKIDGTPVEIHNASEAIRAGLALVPEDRKIQGLFLKMPISFNFSIANLKAVIHSLKVDWKRENTEIDAYRNLMKIKMEGKTQNVAALSGGNQQKVLISRWLFSDPKILILDEPTKGIDIGAKADIYKLLDDLTEKGISVIMISSELPEIIGMCDRVYIMHEGTITGCLSRQEMSQETIMDYAVGGKQHEE